MYVWPWILKFILIVNSSHMLKIHTHMCDIPYNVCLSCTSLHYSTRFPHVQPLGPHPVWHLSWNMKDPRPTQQINNTEQTSAIHVIFLDAIWTARCPLPHLRTTLSSCLTASILPGPWENRCIAQQCPSLQSLLLTSQKHRARLKERTRSPPLFQPFKTA